MSLFMLFAAVMFMVHMVAAAQRPRIAVIASGVLWLLYAIYEHYIATGVLCDANCNIRVDLVLFFPILALATYCAYQSYEGNEGAARVAGIALAIIGLLVLALVAEGFGYGILATCVIGVGALAFWLYRRKARSRPTT